MRERGAFGFLGIILLLTILFFAFEDEQTESTVGGVHDGSVALIMINGRPFESNFTAKGDEGRVIVVLDKEDLFIGENTVELRWGNASQSTMTADLPSERQKH